ncbi:MAG TPA: DEAD/DEAH box helicase [Rhizomicrobium sp.]|jgi:ATP-dependent RNA helicase RhlE|nr:DEAD/DEAH box helicase [Rhizomicrobium sp.]
MTDITFAALGLAEPILRALSGENYTSPTPIQAKAIPVLLEGRDLLGIAQTGTGKTAAFAIPMLQKLSIGHVPPGPNQARGLILAPTRELAVQIEQSLRTYGRHLNLRMAVILGGVNQNGQVRAMARGVDILVATPGRLLDLVQQKHVRLDAVEVFVVDEADRMLDMGFIRDVRKLVAFLPKKRQSMLFSATMPDDIANLSREMMQDPARVEVAPQGRTADRIVQKLYYVPMPQKRQLLSRLLEDVALYRVIVFTRTKHGANRVAEHLSRQRIPAEAIHGNKSQNARQRALELFRSGKARVLVATDIAARGIDIDDITHVINFELPNEPESYVHRIGRTARAGGEGVAISFCDPTERGYLRDIERLIRNKIEVVAHDLPDLPPEQVSQQRPAQNHRHGAHNPHKPQQKAGHDGHNPHAPKKRNGSQPYWSKERRAQRGGRSGGPAKATGAAR